MVRAIGLHLIDRPDQAPAFDPSRPVTTQRPFVCPAPDLCKPVLIRDADGAAPEVAGVFDHLYLFDLRWLDLPSGGTMLDDERRIAARQALDLLQVRDDVEFDLLSDPIGDFTWQVNRAGAFTPAAVWRLPERFIGQF